MIKNQHSNEYCRQLLFKITGNLYMIYWRPLEVSLDRNLISRGNLVNIRVAESTDVRVLHIITTKA